MPKVNCKHLCMGGVGKNLPDGCAIKKGIGWDNEWCKVEKVGYPCAIQAIAEEVEAGVNLAREAGVTIPDTGPIAITITEVK